jgi:hypothetical protein
VTQPGDRPVDELAVDRLGDLGEAKTGLQLDDRQTDLAGLGHHLGRYHAERPTHLEEQCGDSTFGQLTDVQPACRIVDPHQADAVGQQHLVTPEQRRDVVEIGAVHPPHDVVQVFTATEDDGARRPQDRVVEHLPQVQRHTTL